MSSHAAGEPVETVTQGGVDEVSEVLLWVMQHKADEAAHTGGMIDHWLKDLQAKVAELEREIRRLQPYEDAVLAMQFAMHPEQRWEE